MNFQLKHTREEPHSKYLEQKQTDQNDNISRVTGGFICNQKDKKKHELSI